MQLRKISEEFGNMQGLRKFFAGNTAKQLPDSSVGIILERLDLCCCKNLSNLLNSIWRLKLLEVQDIDSCSKLTRLPEQLVKMQCSKKLYASHTAIEVPDSLGLLSTL